MFAVYVYRMFGKKKNTMYIVHELYLNMFSIMKVNLDLLTLFFEWL